MISFKGITYLKRLEKFMPEPYDDQTGKLIPMWCRGATIGYGHLMKYSEWDDFKNGISEEDAVNLLKCDLKPFVRIVEYCIKYKKLTQYETDALVILAFNIGVSGFDKSSVVKLINHDNVHTP